MESDCPVCFCLVRPEAYMEDLKSHSNTTSTRGKGVTHRGAKGGRASRERGRLDGMATLIRIHFQPGPWNAFVLVTGLHFPLVLIPARLTPSNGAGAGNSATGMPLYLQSRPPHRSPLAYVVIDEAALRGSQVYGGCRYPIIYEALILG